MTRRSTVGYAALFTAAVTGAVLIPDEYYSASDRYHGLEGKHKGLRVVVEPGKSIEFPMLTPEIADQLSPYGIRVVYAIASDGSDRGFYEKSIPTAISAIQHAMEQQFGGHRLSFLPNITLYRLTYTGKELRDAGDDAPRLVMQEISRSLSNSDGKKYLNLVYLDSRVAHANLCAASFDDGAQIMLRQPSRSGFSVKSGPAGGYTDFPDSGCFYKFPKSSADPTHMEYRALSRLFAAIGIDLSCYRAVPQDPIRYDVHKPGCPHVASNKYLRGPRAVEETIWQRLQQSPVLGAPRGATYSVPEDPLVWRKDFENGTIFWTHRDGACVMSIQNRECLDPAAQRSFDTLQPN